MKAKVKIAVLSDTRLPTLPDGPHGLGRSAHDIARGLAQRGYEVTLFAGVGSNFAFGQLCEDGDEIIRANRISRQPMVWDAILDTSHKHQLWKLRPNWPIVNRMGDRECVYQPGNAVVNSGSMRQMYPSARLVKTGVDVDSIPFFPESNGYLAFMSAQFVHKGWPAVKRIAAQCNRPLRVIEGMTGSEKWEALGPSSVLLHPSTMDAAPRSPLEAAACGVPTVCLDGDGTTDHVSNGVTGFHAPDLNQFPLYIKEACELSRQVCREWVADVHGYGRMIEAYEGMLLNVMDGGRW